MNKYVWRNNITATAFKEEETICGKLAFKTKQTEWIDTPAAVIVLMSIHSAMHSGIEGELKMHALMSTIKSHVKGRITVLFSDRAHLRTESLNYQGDQEMAFQATLHQAQVLAERYQVHLEACNVVYWHDYICRDTSFEMAWSSVQGLYDTDLAFKGLVYADAAATYTYKRKLEFPNKLQFIERTIEDLLEQSTCLLVLAKKGYRFQFYPGKSFACTEYANQVLIPADKQVSWIDVFLTIEKKTVESGTSRLH